MISREDQTWTNIVNNGGTGETQTTLFEIALSLGRIADMLAEMNDYVVEYGEQSRAAEEPVRHAKWIAGKSDGHVQCSFCGKDYDWTNEAQYYNFCPTCGHLMDEE